MKRGRKPNYTVVITCPDCGSDMRRYGKNKLVSGKESIFFECVDCNSRYRVYDGVIKSKCKKRQRKEQVQQALITGGRIILGRCASGSA